MSTGTSCHFSHNVASFKKSVISLILYNKFSLAGADSPQGTKFWCQQICLVTSFICCKFKKNVFEIWFYTFFFFFFHDLIHVAPAQGQRDPRGLNFGVNRKALSLFPFVASFKKSLWSLILYSFVHDLIHVFSPGVKNRCSRANNSKVNNPIRPKFELVRAFMPVLITCKFDKDPIKGDWEKLETSFFSPLKGG